MQLLNPIGDTLAYPRILCSVGNKAAVQAIHMIIYYYDVTKHFNYFAYCDFDIKCSENVRTTMIASNRRSNLGC